MNTNAKETIHLLNETYKSARIAMDAINLLLDKTYSSDFKNILQTQYNNYYSIAEQTAEELYGYRCLPAENDFIDKIGMWSAVSMGTLTNQNTEHMAEILINGSTMGVIDMTKMIHSNNNASSPAKNIAQKLIDADQNNIEIMRNYLI